MKSRSRNLFQSIHCLLATTLLLSAAVAQEVETSSNASGTVSIPVPDLRDDDTKVKLRFGNSVFVILPIADPTFEASLVLAGAYFHPRSGEKKKVQPPSVTAGFGMYSATESLAYGIAQQSYWAENKWRFNGLATHVDLNLELTPPPSNGSSGNEDWTIKGDLLRAAVYRRIAGRWYAGVVARFITIDQKIDFVIPASPLKIDTDLKSVGAGFDVEHDSRDNPFNSHSGHYFQLKALFHISALGSSDDYRHFSANYRSYHSFSDSTVLAWEARACAKTGLIPLWDACRVDLRGYGASRYLSESSGSAQAELRWQFRPRLGAVVFAGIGYAHKSFSAAQGDESVDSYGIGARLMVSRIHRINMRLDYARSGGGSEIYLSFAESF